MYDIEMPMNSERELPEFYLRQEDLPEILSWDVGGQYYVVMKVEMTELEKKANLADKLDKTKMSAKFKVHSIRAVGKKPIDPTEIERKEWDDLVMQVKSGRA